MIGDGESAAGACVEQLASELLPDRQPPVASQHAIEMHRPRNGGDPVLRNDHDPGVPLLEEVDEVAADAVDVAQVSRQLRDVGTVLLQSVIEVREVYERQRGVVPALDEEELPQQADHPSLCGRCSL